LSEKLVVLLELVHSGPECFELFLLPRSGFTSMFLVAFAVFASTLVVIVVLVV
jgi:hypothetical protein